MRNQERNILLTYIFIHIVIGMRRKNLKLATILNLLAKEEDILAAPLSSISKLLVEREAHREFMTQRVQILCAEPLKAYHVFHIMNAYIFIKY